MYRFCVSILGYGFTALFKIPETCPSASHAKQVLEGMQQNKTPEKNHIVCIVSKDVVQHFTRILERIIHSAICRKCTPKVVSLPYFQKSTNVSCSEGHVLSNVMVAYYTKNVIIAFKILISKCRQFSAEEHLHLL